MVLKLIEQRIAELDARLDQKDAASDVDALIRMRRDLVRIRQSKQSEQAALRQQLRGTIPFACNEKRLSHLYG